MHGSQNQSFIHECTGVLFWRNVLLGNVALSRYWGGFGKCWFEVDHARWRTADVLKNKPRVITWGKAWFPNVTVVLQNNQIRKHFALSNAFIQKTTEDWRFFHLQLCPKESLYDLCLSVLFFTVTWCLCGSVGLCAPLSLEDSEGQQWDGSSGNLLCGCAEL